MHTKKENEVNYTCHSTSYLKCAVFARMNKVNTEFSLSFNIFIQSEIRILVKTQL